LLEKGRRSKKKGDEKSVRSIGKKAEEGKTLRPRKREKKGMKSPFRRRKNYGSEKDKLI